MMTISDIAKLALASERLLLGVLDVRFGSK